MVFRFTYAFHAREVRFECDRGDGFVRVFPETFSFQVDRHDPAEIYLQLDDLSRKPRLLSPHARRRDADILVSRLLIAVPGYLERTLDRLEGEGRLEGRALTRVYQDVALLAQVLLRFVSAKGIEEDRPGVRMASFHLRKLVFRALLGLSRRRVSPAYFAGYTDGTVDPVDPADDLSEAGFFHTMEGGEPDAVDRCLVRLTERAFYRWLEDVCLDESNRAFEVEGSPFEDRETEVRRAIIRHDAPSMTRASELSPFLRRPGNRDCMRVLSKLEAWFLRQYDVQHAAVVILHADQLSRGIVAPEKAVSRHTTPNYVALLAMLASPYLGAIFAYRRAPEFFDLLCSAEMILAVASVLWFLLYRFCWKRDLAFFHASVPRIGAGIIVGYLPIFFIDEVWSLASRSWFALSSIALLLGLITLLYLYIEVKRRLGDTALAFARARQIFFLGVVQAFGAGLVLTGLVGSFMASRNWGIGDEITPIDELAVSLAPFAGELPRIVGFEPFWSFPPALFVMTFLSFFIGTFLQLMWEDIPITEPL